jgi:ferredoxin-like protein FixX
MELAENKAGVTPLVVQVCNETSELLRDTVMGAILSEHDTDVAMLATAFSAFDGAEEQRAHYQALIEAAIATVYGPGGWIDQHIECRTWESQECVDCGECRIDCQTTREECDLDEAELRLKYIDVINTVTTPAYCDESGHIHPPQEETIVTIADHHLNKEKMEAYLAALAAFEACEETETEHCTSCPENPHSCTLGLDLCPCLNHTTTRNNCNTIQQSLQHAQCESRHSVSNYMQLYTQAFEGAAMRYQMVKSQIEIMERDRKVEWDTLERVICLLMTLSIDEDGSASSVETENAIAECRPGGMVVDTSHLDIHYPVPPGLGDLPGLPHSPCSDEFEVDAYDGVPPGCAGNEELQHQFEHGLITECECSAEAPTPREIGFPYELGPFLLFDTGLALNSAEGFQVNEGMDAWEAVYEGVTYRGRCSPFASVTLPDLDAAFQLGLDSGDLVDRVAWAYPDNAAYDEMLVGLSSDGDDHTDGRYTETMTHRFLRTGGFVYLNEAGVAVALKEIEKAPPALIVAEEAQLTLTFGEPQGITEDQANHACPGGFAPITIQSLRDAGALEYCWDKSNTLSFCPHGCFTYRTEGLEGLGVIAFPVVDSTAHIPPAHYAPTDQQGATVASLITGVLAATNPPTEAQED